MPEDDFEKALLKETEIFDELICDILKPFNVPRDKIESIVDWHKRGRNEVIQALKTTIGRLRKALDENMLQQVNKDLKSKNLTLKNKNQRLYQEIQNLKK